MNDRIGIVGGGVAGLYAAWLLERAGRDCVLLEGRDRFGGRLLGVRLGEADAPADPGTFDLGATWYWPAMQPTLAALFDELGLQSFPQHAEGEIVVEGQPGQTRRMRDFDGSPPAMRLAGGMASLLRALRSTLNPDRLLAGRRVHALTLTDRGIVIDTRDAVGGGAAVEVDRVLLAVPPRLARSTLRFDAPLPDGVAAHWAATDTWMAPHAKYLAVYPEPFWRSRGLSGGARSRSGPMVEVHDASDREGLGALFGFVGVPAAHRARVPEADLRQACRVQLGRLFGPQAADPIRDWLQDWSREPFTATAADLLADGQHGHGAAQVEDGAWSGRLVGIASEWSGEFPGYIAGAIDAARLGVERVLRGDTPTRSHPGATPA
jgi:monoamine oxidase